MKMVPVVFKWQEVEVISAEGELSRRRAMVPLARYDNVAGRQFEDGEEYPLVILEARSRRSHSQFFAAVHQGFQNLPEDLSVIRERLNIKTVPPGGWIDDDHLRKWCLCETNFCDVLEVDFESQQEAMRLARFYRQQDRYAQIFVRGNHVTIKTAKSQSAAAMAKQEFEDSKRAVLDLIETMTDLKRGTLNKEAKRIAS